MKKFINLTAVAAGLLASVAAHAGPLQSWMSPEVGQAWNQGYKGQGVTIQVIDDFRSNYGIYGNLGTGVKLQRHGSWTLEESRLLAPLAKFNAVDYSSNTTVKLNRGLNVLNLSYGIYAPDGYSVSQLNWDTQDRSIISHAIYGRAVLAKAAGNEGVAVGAAGADGEADYFSRALAGTPTTIFVGALDRNGSLTNKANLASYSNYAGSDPVVQKNFLVVGVEGNKTGLYGTSFAAPVISGYAAILGSKFRTASPTQITNQLLNTARTDTINNYDVAVHGRGEASIMRALAPAAIR